MNQNIINKIKEAVQQQMPMLNLSTINRNTLPKITQGLNNIVKTQDTLKQQQNQLVQQQPAQVNQPQQPQIHEDEPYPGSVDGTGESKAYEPKSLPAMTTPTMGSTPDAKPMGMKDMAADTMPILEDEPEMAEPEQPVQRYEIEDHINELLQSMFGFRYYFGKDYEQSKTPAPSVVQKKDIQGSLFQKSQPEQKQYPYWEKIGFGRQEQLLSHRDFAQMMKLLDFDKFGEALNALIRLKERNLQENFVKSEIFSIIAENETPKISKEELISYLKTKNL